MEEIERLLIIVGKKIAELRESKKISQDKLSLATDIARSYMSSIECGKQNVSFKILAKIAVALDVEISELVPSLREIKGKN